MVKYRRGKRKKEDGEQREPEAQRPPIIDPLLSKLPPNVQQPLLKLKTHEGAILKRLNEDPEMANLFLRDPGGAIAKMKIPIDPVLRKRAKVVGAEEFFKTRRFCLPNGKSVTPKIRIRFVAHKEVT